MQETHGHPTAPIWLVADSEPVRWADRLDAPLDRRHPTRNSIWTPVWDDLQQSLFVVAGVRLADSALHTRNAVRRAADKPRETASDWQPYETASRSAIELSQALRIHQPMLVVSFGAFAFELYRRAFGALADAPTDARTIRFWKAIRLGAEFQQRVSAPATDLPHLLPLLHVSVARGKCLSVQQQFCEGAAAGTQDYFGFAGTRLADMVIGREPELRARGAFLARGVLA